MNRMSQTVQDLEQLNDRLSVLIHELQTLAGAPAEEGDATRMLDVLDRMLENLQMQFDLEEQHGYLADVLDRYPNWYPQMLHLQQEHRLLHQQLQEIRDRIAGRPAAAVIPEVRRQLQDWIDSFRAHDHRERCLIQDAFTLEVGAGD